MDKPKRKLLQSRADIDTLLDLFYSRVKMDPLIGPIFSDVAHVNWDVHIKKIQNFWDSLLFGADNYDGRPFPPHAPLGLKPEHFQRWLELFFMSVDELYEGQKADEVKMRAYNIGRNFLGNIERLKSLQGS